MNQRDRELTTQFNASLAQYEANIRLLPGIQAQTNRQAFVAQLIESVHRVLYVPTIRNRDISNRRADPNDELFDPIKAAIIHQRNEDNDEAAWLVFLFVHFGKNLQGGYRYIREVYGQCGGPGRWDWLATSRDPGAFREWLRINQGYIARKNVPGGFGNHRKYQSLDAMSSQGTGVAVESYVNWVGPPRTHQMLFNQIYQQANGDSGRAFDSLYRSMKAVSQFGRMARFDYLTMIGKLELANIMPSSTYLIGATGPLPGARLLFGRTQSAKILDEWLIELDIYLQVGMQVLEDSLCNWQKSPTMFLPFRG